MGIEPMSICVPRAAFTDVETFQALGGPGGRHRQVSTESP